MTGGSLSISFLGKRQRAGRRSSPHRCHKNLAALTARCKSERAVRIAQRKLVRDDRTDVDRLERLDRLTKRALDSENTDDRELVVEDPTRIDRSKVAVAGNAEDRGDSPSC